MNQELLEKYEKLILKKEKELQEIVINAWGEDKVPLCSIEYFGKEKESNKVLGTAYKSVVTLNRGLLLEYGEEYINEVFVHEYAHLVCYMFFPTMTKGRKRVRPHGSEFKAICSHFGISGKATTGLFQDSKTLEKNKRNTRPWIYTCKCTGINVEESVKNKEMTESYVQHGISTRMHNLIEKQGRGFKCKKCNENIVYSHKI